MDKRRICLYDVNGAMIREMDVSDIDNANAQIALTLTVETRCDLAQWHTSSIWRIPPWGERLIGETPEREW